MALDYIPHNWPDAEVSVSKSPAELSHSPKDIQLLILVLWVMSLTEVGLVTEKL